MTQLGTTKQTKERLIEMFDLYTSVEQSTRESQEIERIHNEAGLETNLYSEGYFEGFIGSEPAYPEKHSYWEGYQIGYQEHWANKRGVEISSYF